VLPNPKQTSDKRICEESEELQALKQKLAAAHLNKARYTQMEEKSYIQQQQKELEAMLEARMAQDRARAEAELYEQKQKELFENMERRKMLRAQVDLKYVCLVLHDPLLGFTFCCVLIAF
jgi:hypothetical protein